ncbi:MAG: FeoA domain-containing protein [Acidobacteria bacterium]|nr:FeoA domain-containing protein [Acidobacteriota bacterium]MDA1235634.1 FeoA domain-containing protein [Acidobacteriota bacterium]
MPWLVLATVVALVYWPRVGLAALLSSRRDRLRRELVEDALKHVLSWEQRGKAATLESLSGAMHASPTTVLQLCTDMQKRGLLHVAPGGFGLTAKGEQLALHVVRAHRLWERYLADDAGLPLDKLHQAAEKAEHGLSADYLDELDAHLGHPQSDPHGDPIPTRDGHLEQLHAVSLAEWPSDKSARIVHMEDEPTVVFQQILAAGLRPGMIVRILDQDEERLVISDGVNEHRLAPAVAANIHVHPTEVGQSLPRVATSLADLNKGVVAEVVEIDDACRGFSRRRLMDLGLTPGAKVSVVLDNTFGDPRAFRIRDTTIALRAEQARLIWVRPLAPAADREGVAA